GRRRPLSRLGKAALTEVTAALARVVGRFPARRLAVGSDDEPLGYVADFLRGSRTSDWRARDGFSYWEALPRVPVPVRAWVGSGDRLMSPPADARGLLACVPDGAVRVVGRASGLAFDPGHMAMVLDERARPVWD